MTVSVGIDPRVSDLVTAIGLVDGDGQVDTSWFDDPLGRAGTILSNPVQRAALLRALEQLLPGDTDLPGWFPLLDHEFGDVYLTVEDDVIGVAAAISATLDLGPTSHPTVRGSIRLPLVDVAGELRPIAGSAEGPVRLGLDLTFDDPAVPVAGFGVAVTVDVDNGASARFELNGVDLGAGPVDLQVDSTELGADLVDAVRVLLQSALTALADSDEKIGRLADHLFAVLGLTGAPPSFDELLADPSVVLRRLVDVVDSPDSLKAWGTHLAGLFGQDLEVTGDATAAVPLRAPLLSLGGDVQLELLLAPSDDGQWLRVGVAVTATTDLAVLDAEATIFAIPLHGAGATQVVPDVAVLLRAPGSGSLVDEEPTLHISALVAGFRLRDGKVLPWLELTDVVLDGVDHGDLDLTDADTVTGVVDAQARNLLSEAFGDSTRARALLALLGDGPPQDDPTSPHTRDVLTLLRDPLGTLSGLYREILADADHTWGPLLAELARLLDLDPTVEGTGTVDDPWRVPIASADPAHLYLAAWNARDAATPDGEQRLRLGLLASARVAPLTSRWLAELLAVDLPGSGPPRFDLVGRQQLELRCDPLGPVQAPSGVTLSAGGVTATARWRPGDPFTAQLAILDAVVQAGDESYGPATWTLPGSGPDLDLGEVAVAILRLLARQALHAYGGDAAYVLGTILGVHRGLPALPADWPLLEPPDGGGLAELIADPAAALRDLVRRLATQTSSAGAPFAPQALRILGALLRGWEAPAGTRPDVDVTVTGDGTPDRPWAVPLPGGGNLQPELLAWLEPAGPPGDSLAFLAAQADSVLDGANLAPFLGRVAAFDPALADQLRGRDPATLGPALDALAAWLRDGDGVVPLASQLVSGANWTRGDVAAVPHQLIPNDPHVIQQIAAQLSAWAGAGPAPPAVLVAAPFGDRTQWTDVLAAIDPGHPAGAHFELRSVPNPADVDLGTVTAVAAAYTADLLAGAAQSELAQLERVVRRVMELTGGRPIMLVAHSVAGLTARTLAAQHPELVSGLVTLGTPHGGTPLSPLTGDAQAAALRVAASIAAPLAGSAAGAILAQLAAALDGAAGPLGPAVPAAAIPAIGGLGAESVPALAIGSAIDGDLVGLLGGAAVAAAGSTPVPDPTHVAFGIRTRLAVPVAAAGEVAVDARASVALGRIALRPDAPEPARPAFGGSVELQASRPGGWLVGTEITGDPAPPRVRWLEAGLTVAPGAPGAIIAQPWLHLYDASLGRAAATVLTLGDARLAPVLDALLTELEAAGDATPAGRLLDLLRAAGLVVDTVDGARTALAGLADLVATPTRTLAARRTQLLDALHASAGLPAGPVVLDLGGGLEASLDPDAGVLRVRTTDDVALAEPFTAAFDVGFDTATMLPAVTATVNAGPAVLSALPGGRVTLAAPPWLEPLVLRPFDAAAAERALAGLLPRLAISGAVTALAGPHTAATIGPVDLLITDPGAWLRRDAALGSGGRLDGDKINGLLKTIAGALGLDGSQGLGLPGGYLLRATGTDPLRFELSGTFGDASVATLAIDLAVDLHPAGGVTPAGTLTATVVLPGDWGTIAIAFSVDSGGVGLVVRPENVDPIRLLPTVDGLGTLLTGATALLPRVLQELVTQIRARPGTHEVLDATLAVAAALGIYGDDAAGFEEPARSARLRAMLAPGWLEQQVADPGVVVDAIVALFAPGRLPLPPGQSVGRVEDRLRWSMPVAGECQLTAELGWAAGVPQVLVGIDGLDTGPVVVVVARLGVVAAGPTARVVLRVDAGEELAFFAPQVEAELDAEGLSVTILPLGADAADKVRIVVVPQPAATLTTDGALQLVQQWLVPLATRFLLPLFEDVLGTPLWTDGPKPRSVLEAAGLIEPGAGPPVQRPQLPELPELSLRGVAALVNGASVTLTDHLNLTAVFTDGRYGLRLYGFVTLPGEGEDGVDVTVRFGTADWLDDQAAGVTVWLLEDDAAAQPPLAIDPRLAVHGLGLLVSGHDDGNLIGEPVEVGGLGGLVFFDASFIEDRQFRLQVDHGGAAVEVQRARVVIDSGGGDAFVAKVLPKELQAPFSAALAYRNNELEVHGGIGGAKDGVQLTFPLDLDLFHIIYLKELYLEALVRQHRTEAIAAITGNASLGPLAVAVTRVGLRAVVDGSGAHLAFKPPDGFGLSLDASVVRAGGFLLVDEARGRYVGALELTVLKKFSLTAIGIVTTKRPDGTPGFSLLLLITVQLPVPIPLAYGFFFAGAGGLLGLNRGMDIDRIRGGLRAGTADSILFPTDIIRRIDTIVRDLEESFPPADGQFLVAPMIAIQWMNPALVSAKVGVIIAIADPPRIAILGVLRVALPTPDAAVVDLKVAFLGAIDFAAGLLSFDASIYDSFIGYADFKLSLEGDIAVRVSWGRSPDLVASIGGFHPSYTPAAHLRLPKMRRITLSLLKDNPRITLQLYFAITSNTVQLGARLELYVGVSGFSVSGDLGFDVLVQIAPFRIDAHMWGRLAVKAGGTDICSISIDLSLVGPTPWIAKGKAKFSILFFSVTVEVEARFGTEQATSLPSQPILSRVLDAFRDVAAWASELDPTVAAGVSLLPPPSNALVVDAAGLLSVRQSLIPLATHIGLVGAVPPADVQRVTVTELHFGTGPTAVLAEHEDVTAGYAPSTFAGAPAADADRLKAPSFVQRPTGVRASAGNALAADLALGHQVAYEQIICDDPDAPPPPSQPAVPAVSFASLVAGGAVGASAGSRQRRAVAERGRAMAATTLEPRFAVTTMDDLHALDDAGTPLHANGAGLPAEALLPLVDAEARLAKLSAAGGRYQIVPEVQVAR
jgi:hypothetical protein